jgi:hypothetical protein
VFLDKDKRVDTVQKHDIYTLISYFLKIHFTLPSHVRLGSPDWFLLFRVCIPRLLHGCYMPRPSHYVMPISTSIRQLSCDSSFEPTNNKYFPIEYYSLLGWDVM